MRREGHARSGHCRGKGKEGLLAIACPACLQVQEVQPITSYDAAGSFLLLGCNNGSIYYVGEEQFPASLPWEVGEEVGG